MIFDNIIIIFKSILLLPLFFFIPGFLINSIIYSNKLFKFDSNIILNIFVSIIITSVTGLLLAQLGIFSLFNIIIILFLISTLLYWKFKNLNPKLKFVSQVKFNQENLIVFLLILTSLFLFFQPSQWIGGERDPGVYISTGIHIAKSGSIFVKDPLIPLMNTSIQEALYDVEPSSVYGFISWKNVNFKYQLPGFFITDLSSGTITPQFLHVFPIWIAIFYSIYGILGAFYVNPVFGIFGIYALYSLGRTLFSWKVGALAGFILVLNFAQIWYARYPLSEIIAQFFILSGLVTFIQFNKNSDKYLAIISAFLFGLSFLTKIESLLLIFPLSIYYIYIISHKKLNASNRVFFVTLLIMFIYSLLDYILFSYPYISLILLSMINPPPFGSDLIKHSGLFTNLNMISWYITKSGLLLAFMGIGITIAKKENRERLFIAFIAVIFCALFTLKITIAPDHPWWVRRFIPIIFPLFALFASYTIIEFSKIKRVGIYLSVATGTFLILSLAAISYPIFNYSEGDGMIKGISELSEYFKDNDIILTGSSFEGYGVSTPLYYIYDKKVIFLFKYDLLPSLGTRELNSPEKVTMGVDYLINKGYNVYVVSPNHIYTDKLLYYLASKYNIDFVGTHEFSFKHLQSALHTFPTDKVNLSMISNIYKVSINKTNIPENITIDIGSPSDVTYLDYGFYDREKWGDIENRWTSGNASMRIPTNGKKSLLISLYCGSFRPDKMSPSNFSIYINDHLLGNFKGYGEYKYYNLTVPIDYLNIPYSTINIISETWKPSEDSGFSDTRDLGINIKKISIEQQ